METTSENYKTPAKLLHWIMAILVIGMVPVGFLMLNEDLGRELRNSLFIAHKNIGSLLLLLIVVRLLYRFFNPPKLAPIELHPLQELAANLTHVGLYAMLIIMPLSGYIRVRAGGFPIEALDALGIPALVPRSDALAALAKTVHLYCGYAIAVLIVLHIGAALMHAIVLRDGIFNRMWPIFGNKKK